MSKITVRADDDLVAELEALEASKSQVVRQALRAYLDDVNASTGRLTDGDVIEDADGGRIRSDDGSLDRLVADRVDELVADRVDAALAHRGIGARAPPQDVNVTVAVEGSVSDADATVDDAEASERAAPERSAGEPAMDESAVDEPAVDDGASVEGESDDAMPDDTESTCSQCGDAIAAGHVYCPNCGEKSSRRAFCECGDEVRSDWAFCPGCGRRTPAADVLESG